MAGKSGDKPKRTYIASEYPENAWLGFLLWKLRKSKGLTQGELAAQLDRTHTYLARIESGKQAIDVVTLFRHCQITGGDAVELIRIVRDDPPELTEEFLNRGKPKKTE